MPKTSSPRTISIAASRRAPPTNERDGPLPLLETDHPQKEGSDSMENQAAGTKSCICHHITPAGATALVAPVGPNEPSEPPPTTNKCNGNLPLLATDHPQKEWVHSMENKGIDGKAGRQLRCFVCHALSGKIKYTIYGCTFCLRGFHVRFHVNCFAMYHYKDS